MHVRLGRGVAALMSARPGGISQAPYADCNLGDHVGDTPEAVAHNRRLVGGALRAEPVWMTQVHGNRMVRLTHRPVTGDASCAGPGTVSEQPVADGAFTTERGLACAVMVADCLPILLAAPGRRGVAALHAGWRGLAGAGDMAGQGIVHTGVRALCEATACDPADLRVWLGPCIGPSHFEVGADVLAGFGVEPMQPHPRFISRAATLWPSEASPRWLADLPGLARDILRAQGVIDIEGGRWCTVSDASRFFSYRRDRVTGRQAACIALV